MPRLRRYYGENHLHFLTSSTHRRAPVFNSERFKREFVGTLARLRSELGFWLLGYVLMPEHFHLLVWPSEVANPCLAPVIPRSLASVGRRGICFVWFQSAGREKQILRRPPELRRDSSG